MVKYKLDNKLHNMPLLPILHFYSYAAVAVQQRPRTHHAQNYTENMPKMLYQLW